MHWRIFNTDIIGPHAWRQTQTLATAEYFARQSLDITQPHTFQYLNGTNKLRMEFPLLQWTTGLSFRMFGEHIWLLRSLMFLIGLITVAGMGQLAKTIFKRSDAFFFAAWTLCFSPLFYYYCVNPLSDLPALCFAVWGLAFFFRWNSERSIKSLVLCVTLLALSALCKLPFVICYVVFAGYGLNALKTRPVPWKQMAIVKCVVLISLVAPAIWYVTVMKEWTPNMVTAGMLNNTLPASTLFSILIGTLVSTLPELLLNYAAVPLFIVGLYFFFRTGKNKNTDRAPLLFLSGAVLAYYLFEMNAITLIHDYYLFPFLPLLFLIVAFGCLKLIDRGKRMRIAVAVMILIMPVTAFLRSDSRWDENNPGFNADLLKYKNELRAATPTDAKIVIGNDESGHIAFYYTQHFGWNFHSDRLTAPELKDLISQGASYLYSDSHTIERDPAIQSCLGDTIATIGSFRIIELKTRVFIPSDSSQVVPEKGQEL